MGYILWAQINMATEMRYFCENLECEDHSIWSDYCVIFEIIATTTK